MWRRLLLLAVTVLAVAAGTARADDVLRPLVDALGSGGFDETSRAVAALAATGNPDAVPVLQRLLAGELVVRDGTVVVGVREGRALRLADLFTGADLGSAARRDVGEIRVNNRLRRDIDAAIGGLTLLSPQASVRRAAAVSVLGSRDPAILPLLDEAIGQEADRRTLRELTSARAAILAFHAEDETVRLEAVDELRERGDRAARRVLAELVRVAPPAVAEAAEEGVAAIERRLAMWSTAQDVTFGLSLGSVLLLAAIGLAVTFGVMGVINLAHGEMVMLGAYTTFVVQTVIRTHAPWLFDWSLLIALPLAFLVVGAVGVLIERGVIRFLYGRPLETLLATWGVSLILQQGVRTIFGPTNRDVGTPSWMSGSMEIGDLTLATSRLVIILFALAVFAVLLVVLKTTSFGLHMRAVTQNRPMASSMGIRTGWVDALTFGTGCGIAGIAGVALSQIDNVSPNLGQNYIIDSFLVVVFGGVGNLWGTLVGAMTLGVVNKVLEPYAGAVLAKILLLVLVILFIQKRPRGLFALKGRSVEG